MPLVTLGSVHTQQNLDGVMCQAKIELMRLMRLARQFTDSHADFLKPSAAGRSSCSICSMFRPGQRTQFSHASILGRMRRTDAGKSWSDRAGLPKRPYLTLDEDQPLTPKGSTALEVPLWPTLWSIEPKHSILVPVSTQPGSNACADPLGVPMGCYPSNPMQASLRGGHYELQRGGQAASFVSLPLVKHGSYATRQVPCRRPQTLKRRRPTPRRSRPIGDGSILRSTPPSRHPRQAHPS